MKRIFTVVLTLIALVAVLFVFSGCLGKDYTPSREGGQVVNQPAPSGGNTGGTAGGSQPSGGGAAGDTGGDDEEDIFGDE